MDHRVFEPRPSGSEARRRNAISMAIVILVAGALWLYSLRGSFGPAPARPGAAAQDSAGHRH